MAIPMTRPRTELKTKTMVTTRTKMAVMATKTGTRSATMIATTIM